MDTLKQTQSPSASQLLARLWQGYASLAADVGKILGAPQEGMTAIPMVNDADAAARAAHLFSQALYEDSTQEMDWLWYAANMTNDAQRRYCLRRALAINPDSDLAQHALAQLQND